MASIEEKVEEHYKKILDELGIRHYGKTESINRTITDALRSADSKSGGSGNNYPDIQLLLENKTARRIPVMIEAKGLKNRLEKISKSGQIELITYYEKDSKRKDGTIQHHAMRCQLFQHYELRRERSCPLRQRHLGQQRLH